MSLIVPLSTSLPKSLRANTGIIDILLRPYLRDNEWGDWQRATHYCKHDPRVCSECMPYLQGCCALHLLAPELRLNAHSPLGLCWNYVSKGITSKFPDTLEGLRCERLGSFAHIYGKKSTLPNPDTTSPASRLLSLKCSACFKCFPMPETKQEVWDFRCTFCLNPVMRMGSKYWLTYVGWELDNHSDLDKLCAQKGTILASPIEDPEFHPVSPMHKFVIEDFSAKRELIPSMLNQQTSTGEARPEHYLYDVDALIKVNLGDRVPSGKREHSMSLSVKGITFKKLRGFRHDFVGSCHRMRTDMGFRSIGINSPLTPDYIEAERKLVLELSTSVSGAPKFLESSYISKRVSYENICGEHDLTLLIIIVSPFGVLTNMAIPPLLLDDLAMRCKIGLNLETMIEEELQVRLTGDDDETKQSLYVKDLLNKFNNKVKLKSYYHMSTELFDLQRPLSENEEDHVQKLLNKTLYSSLKGDFFKPVSEGLEAYLKKFTNENSQNHPSQVTIFPMVIAKPRYIFQRDSFVEIGQNISAPSHLYKICKMADTKFYLMYEKMHNNNAVNKAFELASEVETVISEKKFNLTPSRKATRHLLREDSKVYPQLLSEEALNIALKGVGAKAKEGEEAILMKEARKKKSFHPDTYVGDISEFWSDTNCFVSGEDWRGWELKDPIMEFIYQDKENHPRKLTEPVESSEFLKIMLDLKLSRLGNIVTDIVSEISMEYKVATRPGEWLVKPLRKHRVILYLYVTGSHTFFFLAYPKEDAHILEKGNIGPELFETQNYWISNISSITESGIEHFIKASSYIPMIASHLLNCYQVPIMATDWMFPNEVVQTLNYMTLTYLNNKIDHEEMITNLRFFYMKLLQEYGSNPKDYVERLPAVLRSRLSVFTLRRIEKLMQYYLENKILRRKVSTPGGIEWGYRNLRTIFHEGFVSFDQMIDSFYYSYVVSKNKSAMGDHSFQIFQKVMKENNKGLDNLESKNIPVWGLLSNPQEHRWDYALERKMLEISELSLKERHGPEVMKMIHTSVFKKLSKLQFSKLATLKASAKDYTGGVHAPDPNKGFTKEEYKREFKSLNTKLVGRRPKVITTLVTLIHAYREETGDMLPTVMSVAIWSMEQLLERGFVLSDLFIKNQHNGVREIHVLEIMARMIQYITEQTAKSICKFFENDTVSSPETKKWFHHNHMKESEKLVGEFISINKSSDASKWCQRNHVSQFFYEMIYFAPPELHNFIYCMFYLWTKKRIALSPELIKNLDLNTSVYTTNEDYIRMRDSFHKGYKPFLEARGTIIEVSFGMFQGICHEASCLKHNIVQTAWKSLAKTFLEKRININTLITIVQGSDDSGAMISIPHHNKGLSLLATGLLWWKDAFAQYASIWCSFPKSSVGTINLIEYNSEWYFHSRNVRPVFRWNSACLETSMVERLSSRTEQFYNSLSQSLESGSSLLLCAVIQQLQARLHYQLIGLDTHPLGQVSLNKLSESKSVSLGYYPLEVDQVAGLLGLDYQMYTLSKQGVKVGNWETEMHSSQNTIMYDSKIDKTLKGTLRNYIVKFSNTQNYKEVLKNTGLPKFASVIEKIKTHPELLYANLQTWEQEEIRMILQLENPMVKASLSSHQPAARMMSASSYLLSTPCVTSWGSSKKPIKRSLYAWLLSASSSLKLSEVDGPPSSKVDQWFVNQEQYKDFDVLLGELKGNISYQQVNLKRTERVEVLIWGVKNPVEVPLVDIVKRQWFKMRTVHCGENAFQVIWNDAVTKYPFLKPTYKETMEALDLEDMALYKLLQTVNAKSRVVRLSDTTSKGSDIWSTATRIYWPQTKIRTSLNLSDSDSRVLKSGLHCVLSYFFKKEFAIDICCQMIRNAKFLDRDSRSLPSHLFQLKIFYDHLTGKSKSKIMEQIEMGRSGVVGYFSKRQSLTERGYSGTGEWIGLINGVSSKLVMIDSQADYITVQRLSDTDNLSRAIRALVRDFGLSYPETGPNSPSNLYLVENKTVIRATKRPPFSIPFIISRSMKIDIKEKLSSQDWFMDKEGNKLKLCFTEAHQKKRAQKFTIISCTFSAKVWDPLLPHPVLDDENFSNWCRGSPAKPLTLSSQMLLPTEQSDVLHMQSLLKEKKYYRPETHYDIHKFLGMLSQVVQRCIGGKEFSEMDPEIKGEVQELQIQHTAPTFSMKDLEKIKDNTISNLLNMSEGVYTDNSTIPTERQDVLQEYEQAFGSNFEEPSNSGEEEHTNGDYSSDSMSMGEDDFDEVREIFKNPDLAFERQRQKWLSGYSENLRQMDTFFSSVIEMIKDTPNSDQIIKRIKESKDLSRLDLFGPGGVLLALIKGSGNYLGTMYSSKTAVHEVTPIGDFMSQSSAQGLSSSNLQLLLRELDQVNTLIPTLSGPILQTMINRSKRLRTEIEFLERSLTATETTSMIPGINKTDFLSLLYRKLIAENLWETPTLHPDESVMVEILVSYSIDALINCVQLGLITQEEAERARAHAWSPTLTEELLKAICMYLRLSLTVTLEDRTIFDYSRGFFRESVLMELSSRNVE
nr:MAG: RNA-dependent RNA polymerase [Inner Mongolia phenui-like virus 2]